MHGTHCVIIPHVTAHLATKALVLRRLPTCSPHWDIAPSRLVHIDMHGTHCVITQHATAHLAAKAHVLRRLPACSPHWDIIKIATP